MVRVDFGDTCVATRAKSVVGRNFRRGLYITVFLFFSLSVAVGAPIRVQKTAEPSVEQIDALHAEYTNALRQLFETHKHAAGCPERTLTIY